jgi:hypothetical protein
MPLSIGQVLENRYRIVSLLGQGSMGAVYKAWHMHFRMHVAIKENLEISPEAKKQLDI